MRRLTFGVPSASVVDLLRPDGPGVHRARCDAVEVIALFDGPLLEGVDRLAWEQVEEVVRLPGLAMLVLTPDLHPGYDWPIGCTAVSATHLYPDAVGPDPACSVSVSVMDDPGVASWSKPRQRALVDALAGTVRVTADGRTRKRTTHRTATRAATVAAGGIARGPTRALSVHDLLGIVHARSRPRGTWIASHEPWTDIAPSDVLHDVDEMLRTWATPRILDQVGSIGGGNHFLELQRGDDGRLYLMAHHGSRGLGAVGAKAFEAMAAPSNPDVDRSTSQRTAFRADSQHGMRYFAFQEAMLAWSTYLHLALHDIVAPLLIEHLQVAVPRWLGHVPHNFIERRHGRYWQRKGATPAYDVEGIPLVVPGSMATASYLLRPGPRAEELGATVPHGAGRVLARGEAKRTLEQNAEDAAFEDVGAMSNARHVPLDESAGAYKDVDAVVSVLNASGVAEVVTRTRPWIVIKGGS